MKNAHIPQADIPPPLINNRSLKHHYTKLVLHIAECTYTQDRCTSHPPIDHRSMEHHYTEEVLHIEECTYTSHILHQ